MLLQKNPAFQLLATCLLVGILTPQFLHAQSCPATPPVNTDNLVGEWEGHYALDGQLYPLQLTIHRQEDGLVAESRLQQLNIPNSRFTTWLCKSNELHLRLDLPDKRVVKMIGTPSDQNYSGRLIYYPDPNSPEKREVFALKKSGPIK